MNFTKLGIVIPLKAKSVSKNWDTVCSALKQTIDSVLNQSSERYQCIVVGHDIPDFFAEEKYGDKKNLGFAYLEEMDPPDRSLYSGEELQLKYEVDRCSKIAKGMLTLQKSNISHWFALDADDLIHKDLVKNFDNWDTSGPIIFDNGYFLYEHLHLLNKTREFSLYCGSCCVIPSSLTEIPECINNESYRTTFFGKYSHCFYKSVFEKQGISYFVPEERVMIYARSHGENISLQISRHKSFMKVLIKIRTFLGMIKNYAVFSDEIKENFSLSSKS